MCDENYCDGWCEERCDDSEEEAAPTYTYMSPAERQGARAGKRAAQQYMWDQHRESMLMEWLWVEGEEK